MTDQVASFVCVDDTKAFLTRVGEVANDCDFSRKPTPTLIENLTGLDNFISRVDLGEEVVPEFMILDVSMDKETDGITALKTIRGSKNLNKCPVIIHSQYLDENTIKQSYIFSANSVVKKPTLIDDQKSALEDIIRYWLDKNTA